MMKKLLIPIAIFIGLSLIISPAFSFKLLFVGDVSCSSNVDEALKDRIPDLVVFLGDLCYGSSLSGFKSTYWNQFPNKAACVIGNHDAPEDGGSSIYVEAKNLCQETWRKKVENKSTVVIGVNTNGNLDLTGSQSLKVLSWLVNETYMKNVKNVIFASHKPADTNPGSHHSVTEDTNAKKAKALIDFLASKVPVGIKVYKISGHNHHMGNNAAKTNFVSGAGGKSHYDCSTSTAWPFCNDSTYGYLQFRIYPDGRIVPWFYNTQGVLIK